MIAVIGGANIYAQTLHLADGIDVTLVHATPEGDAHFAPLDAAVWREAGRERYAAGDADSADFSYVTYRRRAADEPRVAMFSLTKLVPIIAPDKHTLRCAV